MSGTSVGRAFARSDCSGDESMALTAAAGRGGYGRSWRCPSRRNDLELSEDGFDGGIAPAKFDRFVSQRLHRGGGLVHRLVAVLEPLQFPHAQKPPTGAPGAAKRQQEDQRNQTDR